MAAYSGSNISNDGLVFAYDINNIEKSWRGEPTTNLFSTFSSNENNAVLVGVSPISLSCGANTIWSRCNYGGGTYLFNHVEALNPYGTKTLVGNLIATVAGGDYRATILNTGASTLNKTFTFSMWVKNNGGISTNISMSIRTNGDGNGPTISKTISNDWQRLSITHTFTGTCTNEIRCYLFGISAGHNILLYHAQLEEKPYATTFINGTRLNTEAILDLTGKHILTANNLTYNSNNTFEFASGNITVPFSSDFDFSIEQTIAMWMKPGTGSNSARRNPYNQAYGGSGTITHETSQSFNYFFGTAGGNAEPYIARTSPFTVTSNELAFVVVTRNQTTNTVRWYKNGVLLATQNAGGYTATNNGSSPIIIGTGYTTNFIGDLMNVAVYKRALTTDEVAQNFTATRSRFGI